MTKHLYKLFYIFTTVILLSACQTNGYIGDLFGRWKLTFVENDMGVTRHDSVFYSFQAYVINIKKIDSYHFWEISKYGEFWHQGDSLKFHMYRTSLDDCKKIGLNDSIETFDIEHLSFHRMTLRSRINGQKLCFVKQ